MIGPQLNPLLGHVGYKDLPVDLGLKVTKLLDGGTQVTVNASKTLNLGELNRAQVTLTPSFTAACLDDFFGVTDCPSNLVYGLSLDGNRGHISYGISANYHNGKGQFKNSTVLGVNLRHNF